MVKHFIPAIGLKTVVFLLFVCSQVFSLLFATVP